MKAKDIMTTAVISVPSESTVDEAVRLMLDHHVSALPVIGADGRLAGLISEGDLMRRLRDADRQRKSWWLETFAGLSNAARDFVAVRSQRVADVMTREVETVGEQTPVPEIARLLESRRIKRVPVVRDGRVIGIVSRANLLQALARVGRNALPSASAADDELRTRVAAALTEVPGAQVNLINFTITDGAVSIWGVTDSDFVEQAIRVATENVPGVRSVDISMGRLPAWGYGI